MGRGAKDFREKWLTIYGVSITSRDAATGEVQTVECRFCSAFGKEEKAGSQRRRTTRIKSFRRPWRPDHIFDHVSVQHRHKYRAYLDSSRQDKERFFRRVERDDAPRTVDVGLEKDAGLVSIAGKGGDLDSGATFFVHKDIVENIFVDLLYDVEERAGKMTRQEFLSVFALQEPDADNVESKEERYACSVGSTLQFELVLNILSTGVSFRQCALSVLDWTAASEPSDSEKGISEARVVAYAEIACAVNLQRIRELLTKSWAYTLVIDDRSKGGRSFLDVRACLCVQSESWRLMNVHILAIPLPENLNGAHVFNAVSKVLEILDSRWRSKLIGCSIDGPSGLTDCHKALGSQIEDVVAPGSFRIWSVRRRLDVLVTATFAKLVDDNFLGTLTAVTGYLRRQQSLIDEMGSKCPWLVDSHWRSLGVVFKWLVSNRVRVNEYIVQKTAACSPPPQWWISVHCLHRCVQEIEPVFVKLQGRGTQQSTQAGELELLAATLRNLGGVTGPLQRIELMALKETDVISGNYAMSLQKAREFVDDQGSFAQSKLTDVAMGASGTVTCTDVLRSVASIFVGILYGIAGIVAEQNAGTIPAAPLPMVLPCELIRLRPGEFSRIVMQQRDRLSLSFDPSEIDKMEMEFGEFHSAATRDKHLRAYMAGQTISTTFGDAWAGFGDNFSLLKSFCGGLATVFPGQSSATETDLRLLNAEEWPSTVFLTDFSLEAVLHSRQFKELRALTIDDS